jgi:hypothetical protein
LLDSLHRLYHELNSILWGHKEHPFSIKAKHMYLDQNYLYA